ncbi:hypothetical protein ACH5RR_025078 [Cinchona calisaya]|uniref:RWP-RK domain-containing protein n=1 Tax=Cinchona calisaya TaxID=153742 RepID=A0ABD2YYL4_9GENT
MAGRDERTCSLTDVGDVDGTFTKSEFLDYIGTNLHLSPVSSSYKKFLVFWDEEDHKRGSSGNRLWRPIQPRRIPMIKYKAKVALQHINLSYNFSILAQFWEPTIVGHQRLLSTSDQPFGLTYLSKGLCSYRKRCLNYLYSCDTNSAVKLRIDGGERRGSDSVTGPPSRVFLHGWPEYSPNVELYSDEEYPLRNEAIRCKIKSYMAVPLFDLTSIRCIGVLELISTAASRRREMDNPAYIFGLISTALQGVELRSSKFTCHFNMEMDLAKSSKGLSHALHDIRNALDEACRGHHLPFAQTWIPSTGGNVLSTTSEEYYLSHTRFSLLRDTCESFQLLSGQGVVWKAFSSGNSCFCRDVTMLSITEYFFAHVARKVLLDSSLAICLKSNHTGDDVYVLELFLPSKTADPQQLLESVLLTLKQHLSSFRLASGTKLGDKMYVEVLKVSEDDQLDCFRLFHATTGDSVGLQDQSSSMHPLLFSEDLWKDFCEFPLLNWDCSHWEDASVSKCSLAEKNDFVGVKDDSLTTQSLKDDSSNINSTASTSRFPDVDYLDTLSAEDPNTLDCWNGFFNVSKIDSDTTTGGSSASKLETINLEIVEKHFPLKLKDAAHSLKVSTSTLKRKCRKLGITRWPRKKNHSTCFTTSIESNKDDEKRNNPDCGLEGLNSYTSAEQGTTCSKQNLLQAATVTSGRVMTIKAA